MKCKDRREQETRSAVRLCHYSGQTAHLYRAGCRVLHVPVARPELVHGPGRTTRAHFSTGYTSNHL